MIFENYEITREAFLLCASVTAVLGFIGLFRMKPWAFAASAMFAGGMYLSFFVYVPYGGHVFGFFLAGIAGVVLGLGVFSAAAVAMFAFLFITGSYELHTFALLSFSAGVAGYTSRLIYQSMSKMSGKFAVLSMAAAGAVAPLLFPVVYYALDFGGTGIGAVSKLNIDWWFRAVSDGALSLVILYTLQRFMPEIMPGGKMLKSILFTILITLTAVCAFAADIQVKADTVDGVLMVTTTQDGIVCTACTVTVEDMDGNVIVSGKPGDGGVFTFEEKLPQQVKIIANDPYGDSVDVLYPENVSTYEELKKSPELADQLEKEIAKLEEKPAVPSITPEQVRSIVSEEVNKAFAENRVPEKKVTPAHMITAGLGYIFGIFGIFALVLVNLRSVKAAPARMKAEPKEKKEKKSGFSFGRKKAEEPEKKEEKTEMGGE